MFTRMLQQISWITQIFASVRMNGKTHLITFPSGEIDLPGRSGKTKDVLKLYGKDAISIFLRKIFISGILLFCTTVGYGQDRISVSGTVKSDQGETIPGVTVVVKGTGLGTVSDLEGSFTIESQIGDVLVFSYVGYETKDVVVEGPSILNVVLEEDLNQLDEVVVVGYGTQKKVNLTGSVSSISGEDLARRNVGQTSMALQGMAPGVTVTQSSGQPGKDGGNIRIRGIGTLGDSNPLILVDGVPNDINNVDPNIIENITVLKDAASAAIYGARAANGVILITTKRGSENEFSINYSTYIGWQQPTNLKDRVDAIDHMELINLANINVGRSPIFSEELISNYTTLNKEDPTIYPNTDWNKEIFTKNGFTQNHLLNFNGGTDKIQIMGALGYYNQDAIIENTGFERYSLRLNSDIQVTSKLKIKADIFLRLMNTEEPGRGIQQTLFYANHISSAEPTTNSFGYAAPSTGSNPLAILKEGGYIRTLSPSIMTTLGFTYDFTEDFFLNFNYTPHFWEDETKNFRTIVDLYYPNGDLFAPGSQTASLLQRNDKFLTNNLWSTLNYQKLFGDHFFKFLLGLSQEDYRHRWFSAFRDDFILPSYEVINAGGSGNQQAGGSGSDWALQSVFGRINYDWNGKYLLEGNFRYDGSSRFANKRKFGFFPSFSVGWRISEESFWNEIKPVVDHFKLRASWGQLGNQNIGTYPYDAYLSPTTHVFNNLPINGLAATDMANPDISWESTAMLNAGVDMEIFKNFSVVFDYYIKSTSGILLKLDVPSIIGLNPPYQNAGIVENNGWDLSINYNGIVNEFRYNLDFSLSDVKNKIKDLKGVNTGTLLVNFEGHPMDSFFGYESIGYFQNETEIEDSPTQFGNVIPGSIKYKDQNEDGVIDGEDRVIIGNRIPRLTYSLNTNLNWKNIDFNIMLQGVGKVDGYLYGTAIMPFNNGSTALKIHKDYWSGENRDATFPSLSFNESNNIQNSSFWIKDASYLRLKNLLVGYSFANNFLNTEKMRIYASAQNLLTIDKFWPGFDVEAPVGVGDYYPQVKTYSLGLNVTF